MTTTIKKVYGIREYTIVERGKINIYTKYLFDYPIEEKSSRWEKVYSVEPFYVKAQLTDLDKFGVSDVQWVKCSSPEEEQAALIASQTAASQTAAAKMEADPIVFWNPYTGDVYKDWDEVVAKGDQDNYDIRKVKLSMVDNDVNFE
jgi:hypothetical protein